MADNLLRDRYAYLLIVRTGKYRSSGTTSNVILKVTGVLAETELHVLNAPDPVKQFLQKANEDWFVLATDSYLGDVVSLTLWFDSVGNRPTW